MRQSGKSHSNGRFWSGARLKAWPNKRHRGCASPAGYSANADRPGPPSTIQLRRRVGVLLGICTAVVGLSFALCGYLLLRRADADPVAAAAKLSTPESVPQLLAAGNDALHDGRVEQALLDFHEALSAQPRSVGARLGLARGELAAGRETDAANDFAQVLQLDVRRTDALLELATIHSHNRSTRILAEKEFATYLNAMPGDAGARLQYARVAAWIGDDELAVQQFSRPEVERLMAFADRRNQAFALVRLGRFGEAQARLQPLAAGHPADRALAEELANLFVRERKWDSALPLYRSLVSRAPDDEHVELSYGQALMAMHDDRGAIAPLSRAIALQPADAVAGLAYARALNNCGQLKASLRQYKRIAPQYSSSATVLREYADALLRARKYGDACKYYARALQYGAHDDSMLVAYAGALSGDGRYRAAVPYMEKAWRDHPSAWVTLQYAKLLQHVGERRRALELLQTITPGDRAIGG
jgi:tetratricopeptide (TPR) repeat protein